MIENKNFALPNKADRTSCLRHSAKFLASLRTSDTLKLVYEIPNPTVGKEKNSKEGR